MPFAKVVQTFCVMSEGLVPPDLSCCQGARYVVVKVWIEGAGVMVVVITSRRFRWVGKRPGRPGAREAELGREAATETDATTWMDSPVPDVLAMRELVNGMAVDVDRVAALPEELVERPAVASMRLDLLSSDGALTSETGFPCADGDRLDETAEADGPAILLFAALIDTRLTVGVPVTMA